jgi:hypothetical protein
MAKHRHVLATRASGDAALLLWIRGKPGCTPDALRERQLNLIDRRVRARARLRKPLIPEQNV